jgi:ABC-2 type transport system ATP-binding protein
MRNAFTPQHISLLDQPAVEVHDLHKTYPGGVEAVRGISFDVAPGEVFGLLGPNGAGKSTTIGMLTTALTPTRGSARVAGIDVSRHPAAARAASGIVFQESVVDAALTGRRNLGVHTQLWGVSRGDAASRLAQLAAPFGLDEILDRSVGSYSGGQRRRLEILRALLSQPAVLFLDEPTVGLDPRIRYELLDLIAGLREQAGMTIVLTTHYLDEAERLCDRVAIIHDGRIVALDSPATLLGHLGTELVELRLERDTEAAMRALRHRGLAGEDAFAIGSTVTIPLRGAGGVETIAAINRLGLPSISVGARRPTLDDVYLRLTGGSLAA